MSNLILKIFFINVGDAGGAIGSALNQNQKINKF